MTIEEGNKLIAEFMGWKYSKSGKTVRRSSHSSPRRLKDIQYHSSWDWLMPVGKKIFDFLQQSFKERPAHTCTTGDLIEVDITCAIREYNLTAVYQHVIQFIQWFNQQPQPEGKGKEVPGE